MKNILGSLLLVLIVMSTVVPRVNGATTTYYWGGGDASDRLNWWTTPVASGTHPAGFTAADQSFYIQSGSATVSGAWTISGLNSSLTIQTGAIFDGQGSNNTLPLILEAGSTYSMSSAGAGLSLLSASPTSLFKTTSSSSSFNWSMGTFGLLTVATPGTLVTSNFTTSSDVTIQSGATLSGARNAAPAVTWNVGRNLLISSGATVTLASGASGTNSTTINVAGGVTNNGTISKSGNLASINFNGSGSSSAKWGAHSGSFAVTVASGKTIGFTDSLSTSGGAVTVAGTVILSSTSTVNTGAGAFNVSGKLAGSGTASSAVTFQAGSTHAVGDNSAALQTLAGGASYTSSTVNWELFSNTVAGRGTQFDAIDIGTSFTVNSSTVAVILNGAGSSVDFAGGFWTTNHSWTIVDSSVTRTGGFTLGTVSLDSLGQSAAAYGHFAMDTLTNNDVNLNWVAVPEPSAAFLLFLGIGAIGLRMKLRTRKI